MQQLSTVFRNMRTGHSPTRLQRLGVNGGPGAVLPPLSYLVMLSFSTPVYLTMLPHLLQVHHQHFSVLLCAPNLMGCWEPSALVTRSNKQIRQLLTASGATFSQAAGAAAAAAAGGPGVAESSQGAAALAGSTNHDGRPGSQLLVRGCRSVHALYLLLLQQPWCAAPEQPDVPLLLAPVPFVGASLQSLKLQVGQGVVWLRVA